MTTATVQTTQVYQVFIRATPEAIWEAITDPEFTQRYFYGMRIEVTPERRRTLRRTTRTIAPKTAASVSGEGWMRVISGLKTLMETGEPLA
jgi:hypothetical protein